MDKRQKEIADSERKIDPVPKKDTKEKKPPSMNN